MPEKHLLRLLSHLDRNPSSPYYGCFHRDFWHYRMASDFPSAIYQMGLLSLCYAYTSEAFPAYRKSGEVLAFIEAAAKFWASIQNQDGSFNEWYPNEHSHVATAFTAWGISEGLLMLEAAERERITGALLPAFRKTGRFLAANIDTVVLNHTAGAIAALYNLYLITGDASLLDTIEKNKQVLFDHQHGEGWYEEYGDFDAGYQSLSIFFLGQYWAKSRDEAALQSLTGAIRFLAHFVHPDGTVGGAYLSRDTHYLFRYGLFLLAPVVPEAAWILGAADAARMANVDTVDDRYFVFFFLPDQLLCLGQKAPDGAAAGPPEGTFFFPASGLLVRRNPRYYFVANLKKGCALELYDRSGGPPLLSSLGYMYGAGSRSASTLGYGGSSYTTEGEEPSTIRHLAGFLSLNLDNPLRCLFVPFRLFNLCLERFTFIHRPFERYLKKKIRRVTKAGGMLERTLLLSEDRVEVNDTLKGIEPGRQPLYEIAGLSFRFVPSSHFSYAAEVQAPRWTEIPLNGKTERSSHRVFTF